MVGAWTKPLEMNWGAQRPAGQMPRKMQSTREKEQAKHWRMRPPGSPRILAAGIDAPMFWSSRGDRAVDEIIRKTLVANGFPSGKAGGAVQAVNALRGAYSAPGVLLGKYRHETGNSKITETHPTALLYLLQASGQAGTIKSRIGGLNDPEHDATIAGFAAWSMLKPPPGWRDLYQEENPARFDPLTHPQAVGCQCRKHPPM